MMGEQDDVEQNMSNNNNNIKTQQQQLVNSPEGLSIFCREVRNLLRSKPNCMIPFSKFVPAYHNHYGRQCCVYQFGYTKLIELLESIPHVVQIIGDGTNRYITLTHREQIKRFASDLIKVVKSQPGKKLKLSQFARAYEQVLGRSFRVEDYGTSNINVLLAEIWEGTINIMPIKREFVDPTFVAGPLFVSRRHHQRQANSSSMMMMKQQQQQLVDCPSLAAEAAAAAATIKAATTTINGEPINKPYITEQYPDAWFEIPKRERSDKEIKRTKYFVWDAIELLSNFGPDYSVTFSKFIPSYHYYFNRQCKVSIFGFSKLIDLFESISPEVVEIIDQGSGEEKLIKLADQHWPINRPNSNNNNSASNRNRSHQHRSRHVQHHHPNHLHHRCQPNTNNTNNATISNSNRLRGHSGDTSEEGKVSEDDEDDDDDQEEEDEYQEDEEECEDEFGFDDELGANDVILPKPQPAIDYGPTEEELMELEAELEAYEAMQAKRSSRMAAMLHLKA